MKIIEMRTLSCLILTPDNFAKRTYPWFSENGVTAPPPRDGERQKTGVKAASLATLTALRDRLAGHGLSTKIDNPGLHRDGALACDFRTEGARAVRLCWLRIAPTLDLVQVQGADWPFCYYSARVKDEQTLVHETASMILCEAQRQLIIPRQEAALRSTGLRLTSGHYGAHSGTYFDLAIGPK